MAGDVVSRRYDGGAIVFSEGDSADGMYVVLRGKVLIGRERDGVEVSLALLSQGDFFGEMALFDGRPRSATAKTVGETELRWISPDEFERMAPDPFVRQMLTTMSGRIRSVDDELTKLEGENHARRDYMSTMSIRREWAV